MAQGHDDADNLDELSKLRQELDASRAREEDLRDKNNSLSQENENLRDKNKDLCDKNQKLLDDNQVLSNENQNLSDDNQNKQKALDDINQQLQRRPESTGISLGDVAMGLCNLALTVVEGTVYLAAGTVQLAVAVAAHNPELVERATDHFASASRSPAEFMMPLNFSHMLSGSRENPSICDSLNPFQRMQLESMLREFSNKK